MADNHRIILGAKLMQVLGPALGLDHQNIRRIVLDIVYDDTIKVYIENIGDERLLSIDWAGNLKDTKLIMVEPK